MSRKRKLSVLIGDERLERKVILDEKTGLLTLAWVWTSPCPLCGDPLENIFHQRPNESFLLELTFMPCEECIDEEVKTLEDNPDLMKEIEAY